ncbi:gliding motility-associated C-terminal domain-containing protein, partial [Marinilabiliaceae bacterium JC017]
SGSITGSYNSSTGVLSISGNASLANYQAALRSVTYENTSDDPSTATRTISFITNDGSINSNTLTRNISVSADNDPPILQSPTTTALPYTENNGAVAILNDITVQDWDNTNLSGATVTISANFNDGEDRLRFTSSGGITGSYNSSTGVLSISGNASLANYQAALRSVTYENTSDNPSTATRTISFITNDGSINSNTLTRNISVSADNDPPILQSPTTTALPYTENDGAVTILNDITVQDWDNTNLSGATITISTNFINNQDRINFTPSGGITGSYNSSTGVLSLSGNSSLSNYQTALRSVTYENTSSHPNTTTRTISFVVNDGIINSNILTRNISLSAANDPPVIQSSITTPLNYIENDGALSILTDITVLDVDNTNLSSATITISSNFYSSEDQLDFTSSNNITGAFNPTTGILLLTGTASLANYQTVLRSVTYENISNNPNTAVRTISFVVNDLTDFSNTLSRNISLSAENDPPILQIPTTTALNYAENDGAVTIFHDITVQDVDNTYLSSATVSISANFSSGEDHLNFTSTDNITGSFNSTTGILSLSGNASLTNYQTLLRSVTYENSSSDPNTAARTISLVVNDGTLNSNNLTRDISVSAENDAPVIQSPTTTTLAYTENDGAIAILNNITVQDVDNTYLSSATVTISANFHNTEDLLSYSPAGSITGSFNSATGILSLSGFASLAFYRTVLRSVTYENSSDNPNTATRTITFVANDGSDYSNTISRNISLSAENDPPALQSPTATALSYTENDGPVTIFNNIALQDVDNTNLISATITISANFNNTEDRLSYNPTSGISGSFNTTTGILTLTGNTTLLNYQTALRSVTYENTSETPVTSPRNISFYINDGQSTSNTLIRTINISSINDDPVANDFMTSTRENQAVNIPIENFTSDADGNLDYNSLVIISPPAHGSVEINSDTHEIIYTPVNGYSGSDTFTYQICDTNDACDEGTLTITISDQAPSAIDDNFTIAEDTPHNLNVLGNDTDPQNNLDGSSLRIVSFPSHGDATITNNSNDYFINYSPALDYNGADTFIYEVCDDDGYCDLAIVTLTISALNDPPIVANDTITISEDTQATINILLNDNDAKDDGNIDISSLQITIAPDHGIAELNQAGNIIYSPDINYSGTDQLTYSIRDYGYPAPGITGSATVHIIINEKNDAPASQDDVYTIQEDTSVEFNVLANDSDSDDMIDPGSLTITSPPSHGDASVNTSNYTISYIPQENYNGPDSFTYRIADPEGLTSLANVTITITPMNDKPTAENDYALALEETAISIPVAENDTDIDDNLDIGNITIINNPDHGSATVEPGTGSISYTPDPNYYGADSFDYRICDTAGACDTATVYIEVTSGNVAPWTQSDYHSMIEDEFTDIYPAQNDTDPNNNLDLTSLSIAQEPMHGEAVVNSTNSLISYIPHKDYTGMDTIIYRICDLGQPSMCATDTIFITILPVNDAPIAQNDTAYIYDGTRETIDVMLNDTDPEMDVLSITLHPDSPELTGELTLLGELFEYTALPGYYNTTDRFIYQVCDTQGLCDTASVILILKPTDSDGDHIPDAIETLDINTDNDATPDYLDEDSDEDGISDQIEGGMTDPSVKQPTDTDNDGIPDYRDTDSDNDQIPDAEEGTDDCDQDGIPNYRDDFDDCEERLDVPDTFSPNGDGINDAFLIPGASELQNDELYIYNRWGGLVYESKDYDNTWMGKSSASLLGSEELTEGTYFYVYKPNNKRQVIKGTIYIKR